MIDAARSYRFFFELVSQPEKKLDLGRAALAIALSSYPLLDTERCIEKIEALAARVKRRAGGEQNALRLVAAAFPSDHRVDLQRRALPNRGATLPLLP